MDSNECTNHLFRGQYQGKCTSCGVNNTQCAVFGLKAELFPIRPTKGVRLFFNTAPQAPFCRKFIVKYFPFNYNDNVV